MITRYINLPDIVRGDLSALKPHERPEALRLLAQGITNLIDAPVASERGLPREDERWLEVEEVEDAYPAIKRRWLFVNADRMTWIKRISRKRLLVDEAGLKRWMRR
jgi:hypothetical protein